MTKIAIVFHSFYGHVWGMAEAIKKGVQEVEGVEVDLMQVQETMPAEVIAKMGATDAQKAFAHIPVCDANSLDKYDGIILGCGTRFGGASAQMRQFIDHTGQLWMGGKLAGKIGSAFCATANQHAGQEMTIQNLHTFFFHHGMVVQGLFHPDILGVEELKGGSPYGATTIAAPKGDRMPSEVELKLAQAQGKSVAELAKKVFP